MERLTYRMSDGSVNWHGGITQAEMAEKLAAYEDTGMEPSDVPTALEMAKMYAVIEELKAARKVLEQNERGGWISVKDRMPEVETEVFILAASPNGDVTKTTAMYEDGSVPVDDSMWSWQDMDFEYDELNGYYVIPEGWFEYRHYNPDDVCNNVVDDTVTHWQPLPQPPKEITP